MKYLTIMRRLCFEASKLRLSTQSLPSASPPNGLNLTTSHYQSTSLPPGVPMLNPNGQLTSTTRCIINAALLPEGSSSTLEKNAKSFCDFYKSLLLPMERCVFLKILAHEYSINHKAVAELSHGLSTSGQERGMSFLLKSEDKLRQALKPQYSQIFCQIGHIEHGVKFIVDMRADLLNILSTSGIDQDNADLRALNSYLREILTLWFSVGLLQLEQITWQSPCDMLQKISEYEAVHPIRNWADLKRRVGPYRRCFVFTHGSMPKEPIVVLHTALTNQIASSIQHIVKNSPVVNEGSEASMSSCETTEDPCAINTAIFYSITSTQKGLQGVELGNYLIKRVVKELVTEFPKMDTFSSLSPIPGFKDWLVGEINTVVHLKEIGEQLDDEERRLFTKSELRSFSAALGITDKPILEVLKKVFSTNSWMQNDHLTRILQPPLMRLCARYLFIEKRRGYCLNPVANFHLRNGAVMWRLNWFGDVSPRGLNASCGLMVNYRYYLDQTEQFSKEYIENQTIEVSSQIHDLVKQVSYYQENKSSFKASLL